MSDGWIAEKGKTIPRERSEWLIDSGLVVLYVLFMVGCFFIAFAHTRLADVRKWSPPSLFLVMLVSPCISYVLNDLKRTVAIFFSSSLLGFISIYVISVALFFHSYTLYSYQIGIDSFWKVSPAVLVLGFVIGIFLISVLGAIAGSYIAERARREEKE